ncbi:T-complex protein 1 subunit theta-like 2 [Talpa occidentalis]|uniref:T-complex protein 1 subunit theta-like 2 n=1 Tax=Talpa occidentalis TaxID=50954 RepID=UPI00188F5931|nr:T-complex protein 1 subunit theta-like 2 [Talpa occidentalis]
MGIRGPLEEPQRAGAGAPRLASEGGSAARGASRSARAMDRGCQTARELPERLGPDPRSRGEPQKPLLSSLPAAQTLARVLRPCYGPHGRQKLLVTAKGETVFTRHATAILRALELEHPAARLLRDAAQAQAEHCGDGTAGLVLLACALLEQAEHLLQAGLPRAQLREAYAAVVAETLALLPALVCHSLGSLEDPFWVLYAAMNTHALAQPQHLAKLVAHACWATRELDGRFQPERVALCVLPGGRPEDSCLLPGLAVSGQPRGLVNMVVGGARVALFACTFGPAQTQAQATARLSSPEELQAFRRGSEQLIEKQVGELVSASINVAVVWGQIDEKTLAQANKRGIMVVEAKSRKEMAYLSQVLETPLLPYMLPPGAPGQCQRVYGQGLGEDLVVVFEWESRSTPALTLVLRGTTRDGLRGAELAAYQGIDVYTQLCQDTRLLPGAGATEMALARMLSDKGTKLAGPEGPAFLAFARALRTLPEILAENAGLATSEVMAEISGAHQAGHYLAGVGAEGLINVAQLQLWDTLITKDQGLRMAAAVVIQLVTIDDIVVAKRSPALQQNLNPEPKKAKKGSSVGKNILGRHKQQHPQ